jgi:hypothetical protein
MGYFFDENVRAVATDLIVLGLSQRILSTPAVINDRFSVARRRIGIVLNHGNFDFWPKVPECGSLHAICIRLATTVEFCYHDTYPFFIINLVPLR